MPIDANHREVAIKRTSEMMLSGWKLLAKLCPICTSALMSKGNQMHCPGCNSDVFTEEEARISGKLNGSASQVRALSSPISDESTQNDSNSDYESEAKGFTSLEEMKREYDRKNKARDAVSAKLGERMLSGWIMLNRACEKEGCWSTPLMCKSSNREHMECVSCGTVYKEGEEKEADSQSSSQAQPKTAPTIQPATALDPSASRLDLNDAPILNLFEKSQTDVRKRDPSELIAAKLLQGWAMLEQACSEDGVPLMRDKEGCVQCVVCRMRTSDRSSAAAEAVTQPLSNKLTSKSTKLSRHIHSNQAKSLQHMRARFIESDEEEVLNSPSEGSEESDGSVATEDADDEQKVFSQYAAKRLASLKNASEKGEKLPKPPLLHTKNPGSSSAGAEGSSYHTRNHRHPDLQYVSNVLKKQLRNATDQLQDKLTVDVEHCTAVAVLIEKLAQALKSVDSI